MKVCVGCNRLFQYPLQDNKEHELHCAWCVGRNNSNPLKCKECLEDKFWEDCIDYWFDGKDDKEDIYCPNCGEVPAMHLHTSISGDKDWRCPEKKNTSM